MWLPRSRTPRRTPSSSACVFPVGRRTRFVCCALEQDINRFGASVQPVIAKIQKEQSAVRRARLLQGEIHVAVLRIDNLLPQQRRSRIDAVDDQQLRFRIRERRDEAIRLLWIGSRDGVQIACRQQRIKLRGKLRRVRHCSRRRNREAARERDGDAEKTVRHQTLHQVKSITYYFDLKVSRTLVFC